MASVSAQMPIIRLRDGIENGQGRGQVINNINACVSVSDYVRTTLGGMDELVVDREGKGANLFFRYFKTCSFCIDKTTISNDGATIMNMFDIVYPAAKIMSDTAKNQDDDVGDGTSSDTSLVFLDKTKKCSQYSRKVFIGGLPFDATEEDINASFEHFGPMSIDWPRRHSSSDGSSPGGSPSGSPDRRQTSGYVFLIYRKESSVHRLLEGCKVDSGRYFMLMSTRNSCRKPVQVRPWRLSDFVYLPTPVATLDPRNTVFIGGVPRPTRAVDIVEAFEKKYGRVIYASIDIDPELRYPKGAARIVFANRCDYLKAMAGRFVSLPYCGTSKRIDVKPYIIDEQECSACNGERCNYRFASYFCAEPNCLQYYCKVCLDQRHYGTSLRVKHLPYVISTHKNKY